MLLLIQFDKKMKTPKLSIVVPVWGVEKYVEKCVRSLFESTLDNIEFIFVNDCTPDKSIEIIQSVIKKYPNRESQTTILHHRENKGLPQARKTGFWATRGEWVTYCDSDDWVAPDMFEKMILKAESEKADVICCDFVYLSDTKVLWKPVCDASISSEQLRLNLLKGSISNAVWNKIVHRSVYEKNGIFFPLESMDEDDVLTIQIAYYAKKLTYLHECLYFHYANPESMTHETKIEKVCNQMREQISNRIWIVNFLEDKKDNQLDEAIFYYKQSVKNLLFALGNDLSSVRKIYPEINTKMIFDSRFSIRQKIYNFFMLYFPKLLCFL